MSSMLEELIVHYGLYTLALAFFFDDLGIFLPTTTILFTSSIYAMQHPDMSIWHVLLIALIIPPISNRILFEFGKHGGRKWLAIHGYKIFLPHRRIRTSEKFIERYGEKTIFATSCIPTFRPFGALIAGSLNMKRSTFTLYNILGTYTMVAVVMVTACTWGDEVWAIIGPYWGYVIIGIILYSILHISILILKQLLMTKRILLIGNGGREHALCNALIRSHHRIKLYNFATGVNPGIKNGAEEIEIGDLTDKKAIQEYAKKIKPDFCVIGPDDPIAVGVTDALHDIGIPSFAPTKSCAQLESSKSFTRNLLKKYNIDASPEFEVFTHTKTTEKRKQFYDKFEGQIVVKADGLLGGKGVLVAGDHFSDFKTAEAFAQKSIEQFGRVVLEEKLIGEEFSLISLVDGKTVLDCPAIQDHKRAYEDDKGPNTGGMGCISDQQHSLPFLSPKDIEDAHNITVQTIQALEKELGEQYIGVLYGGFMVTKRGVKLIEYNARFGDPEALNILPILQTDFVDICEKALKGRLSEIGSLEFREQATVLKYLCPEGYPEKPLKNVPLSIEKFDENENQKVFMASLVEKDGQFILKGSRAIGVLGVGNTLQEANQRCEDLIPHFKGPLFYRKDIGTDELMQKRIDHMNDRGLLPKQ